MGIEIYKIRNVTVRRRNKVRLSQQVESVRLFRDSTTGSISDLEAEGASTYNLPLPTSVRFCADKLSASQPQTDRKDHEQTEALTSSVFEIIFLDRCCRLPGLLLERLWRVVPRCRQTTTVSQ